MHDYSFIYNASGLCDARFNSSMSDEVMDYLGCSLEQPLLFLNAPERGNIKIIFVMWINIRT